jgi:hypothetical protein
MHEDGYVILNGKLYGHGFPMGEERRLEEKVPFQVQWSWNFLIQGVKSVEFHENALGAHLNP